MGEFLFLYFHLSETLKRTVEIKWNENAKVLQNVLHVIFSPPPTQFNLNPAMIIRKLLVQQSLFLLALGSFVK